VPDQADSAPDIEPVGLVEGDAEHPTAARRRLQQGCDHPQQRGLAGSVGAEHPDRFTAGDLEVDSTQDGRRPGTHVDTAQFDQGHGRRHGPECRKDAGGGTVAPTMPGISMPS
jgi:hypothetical protein